MPAHPVPRRLSCSQSPSQSRPFPASRNRVLAAAVAAVAVAAAGISSAPGAAAATGGLTAPAGSQPARVVAETAHSLGGFTTDEKWVPGDALDVPVIGMRAGLHRRYDRIVIDIATANPNCGAYYLPDGRLQIVVGAVPHPTLPSSSSYSGPARLIPYFPSVRRVTHQPVPDYVITQGFVVRLHGHPGFRVFRLDDGDASRFVVDVAH